MNITNGLIIVLKKVALYFFRSGKNEKCVCVWERLSLCMCVYVCESEWHMCIFEGVVGDI